MNMHTQPLQKLLQQFQTAFQSMPTVNVFAPGRVEVLGNHTDYNEGFVLSAAIDSGIYFAIAPIPGNTCRLVAADFGAEISFRADNPAVIADAPWAAYSMGVHEGLLAHMPKPIAWQAAFCGTVPRGSGLSSSAAIAMATARAICTIANINPEPLAIAKIGQMAEHRFAGVRCGLLDQLSSLCGKAGHLLEIDFRSFDVAPRPLDSNASLLLVNSGTTHTLGDGVYNERRNDCEAATKAFAEILPHPVAALRDVSMPEWIEHHTKIPERIARRAAHVIGENTRVQDAAEALQRGDINHFGFLMFESHHSSMVNFENSCPALDTIIQTARQTPGVLGGRLSGGGFGGSAILLVETSQLDQVCASLDAQLKAALGHTCELQRMHPADGAHIIENA
ncbi:MAG: galactokinase [Kiritimatiellia bacterium]